MKVVQVAVYLDEEQANLIRWTAQNAVLASDHRQAGHLQGDRR